jgi:hypothetical protein
LIVTLHVFTGIYSRMLGLVILMFCLFLPIRAHAHAPYEVPVGKFQRSDGKTVSVAEHYQDGLIGPDYVIHYFRSEDGEVVATTQLSKRTVITRPLSNAAEIYYYRGAWIPVATHVIRFDGYTFSEATTDTTKLFSLLLHIWHAKRLYVLALMVAGIILLLWWFLYRLPPDRVLLRITVALVFVPLCLCWIMFLLFAPISPFITGLGAAVLLVFISCVRKTRQLHIPSP